MPWNGLTVSILWQFNLSHCVDQWPTSLIHYG